MIHSVRDAEVVDIISHSRGSIQRLAIVGSADVYILSRLVEEDFKMGEFDADAYVWIGFEEVNEAIAIIGFGEGFQGVVEFQLKQRLDKGVGNNRIVGEEGVVFEADIFQYERVPAPIELEVGMGGEGFPAIVFNVIQCDFMGTLVSSACDGKNHDDE